MTSMIILSQNPSMIPNIPVIPNCMLTMLGKQAIIIQEFLRREGDIKVANEVGKRYVCEKCGSEFIVTKGGEGKLICCNQPMTLKK
jgi:desulfoferrodoxin-like iron-binding protein